MSQRVDSSAPHKSVFLAGLFDDVTTHQVLMEMDLGSALKRDAHDRLASSVLESNLDRPLKKHRVLSSLSSFSYRLPSSTRNLRDLSFPPCEMHALSMKHQQQGLVDVYAPLPQGALPVPKISLIRRQSSYLMSEKRMDMSPKDNIGGTKCPDFVLPDTISMSDASCESSSSKKVENGSCMPKSQLEDNQRPSNDSNFGWFVDLDSIHHGFGSKQQGARQIQFPSNNDERHFGDASSRYGLSLDNETTSFAPKKNYPDGKDACVELEWAMAVDTIDSIFGGDECG